MGALWEQWAVALGVLGAGVNGLGVHWGYWALGVHWGYWALGPEYAYLQHKSTVTIALFARPYYIVLHSCACSQNQTTKSMRL